MSSVPGVHGSIEMLLTHLRSCLRRAEISSASRAEPSSAVSTLRCSLAFSPARRRLLSSRSSRLLSKSAVAGLGAGKEPVIPAGPSSQAGSGGGETGRKGEGAIPEKEKIECGGGSP